MLDRTLRQGTQPFKVRRLERSARPEGGDRCHRVELFQIREAGASAIVVAANHRRTHGDHALADFVGAGVVADYVAEIHHAVISGRRRKTGLKRFKVRVNVTYEKKSHG